MDLVAGAAPLLAFLVFWANALVAPAARRRLTASVIGEAFLQSAVLWGVCVVAFNELLSLWGLLTADALTACWLLACLAGLVALVAQRPQKSLTGQPEHADSAGKRESNTIWYISLAVAVLLLAFTGVISVVIPPNNWDAMAYHMARVQHWMQNQSVAFYPTNDPRQLFDPPWAEYAILQFQLLTGGGRMANLVQWFSEVGSGVAILLIARQLGANRIGQGLALVFAVTTPMVILEASSTENDLTTGFWILVLIYFTLRYTSQPTWRLACLAGCALGLAVLTKGTAYVYAAPVLLGLGLWLVARLWQAWQAPSSGADHAAMTAWRRAALGVALMGALVIALNSGQWARNASAFHSPLGPDGASYAVQTFTPGALLCNAARDVTLNLGAASDAQNADMYRSIVGFCGAVGEQVNDPRITWQGVTSLVVYLINPFNTDQGTAGNPVQFVLIVLVLAAILAFARLRRVRRLAAYAGLLALGYALFCGYIRWQPWGNRLLVPWFLAAAPLVGVALGRLAAARFSVPILQIVLVVAALPFLLLNDNAPLWGSMTVFNTSRVDLYFITNRIMRQPYEEAARYLQARQCSDIGFHSLEGWEYPLWPLIGTPRRPVHIEHVLVTNASQDLGDAQYARFQPCAILNVIDVRSPEPSVVSVHGVTYHVTWKSGAVEIYLPVRGDTTYSGAAAQVAP